jgi:hypothetical protein
MESPVCAMRNSTILLESRKMIKALAIDFCKIEIPLNDLAKIVGVAE